MVSSLAAVRLTSERNAEDSTARFVRKSLGSFCSFPVWPKDASNGLPCERREAFDCTKSASSTEWRTLFRARWSTGSTPWAWMASTAEHVRIGGVRMAEPSGYRVIVDRISHDIPFYRAYLKNAVLTGTTVINNPFWWGADDKFFNYALASKIGVAIPPTVLLPHKSHPPGTTRQSMRNLIYPAQLGGDFRLHRVPRVPETIQRRRMEERVQSPQSGRIVPGLR